jgi:hypothetical protein
MEILQHLDPGKFIWVIFFLLPGFVILKSKDLIFSSSDKDFSKKTIEIFLYSCLHFLLVFYPIYYWIFKTDILLSKTDVLFKTNILLFKIGTISINFSYILILVIEIAIPFLYPHLFKLLFYKFKFVRNKIISPIGRPWEEFFSRREPVWVVIHLKEGKPIIGYFSDKSFASLSLGNEQIYLEKLCKLDKTGKIVPIKNSKGGIFNKDCWEYIRFLENNPSQSPQKEAQNEP